MTDAEHYTTEMATLAVRLGANVQPGQIVAVSSEPGKEAMSRAIAEAAYAAGAKFVDLTVFDVYFKRARALNAERDTLGYVPPWLGERILALGEHRARADRAVGAGGTARPRRRRSRAHQPRPAAAGPRGDEGPQRRHHQLDDRPVPDARRGPRSCYPGWSRRPRWSGCGQRSHM